MSHREDKREGGERRPSRDGQGLGHGRLVSGVDL